jgi:hypothetical protein
MHIIISIMSLSDLSWCDGLLLICCVHSCSIQLFLPGEWLRCNFEGILLCGSKQSRAIDKILKSRILASISELDRFLESTTLGRAELLRALLSFDVFWEQNSWEQALMLLLLFCSLAWNVIAPFFLC